MRFKSNAFRFVFSFCLIFCLALAAFADTIRLKDGSIIKGKIIGFRDGQFLVQIGEGARSRQMTFFADEIDAIEFDSNAIVPFNNGSSNSPGSVLPRPANNTAANPQNPPNTNNSGVLNQGNGVKPTNQQTVSPNPTAPDNSATTNTPAASNPTNTVPTQQTSTRPRPIQLNLKVLADNTANGWTNAGWVVKKGQKIKITGSGRISLGGGNFSTPAGISSLADKDKLMQKEATGGLIAVIGDDNNDFIFIGTSREFIAPRDGALFLGINEGNLDDNSGAFDIVIEIDPGSGR
jgi:hypothetical protein